MQPAHMPTGLDYDDQRFSQLDSTRNDEGPLQSVIGARTFA
jgi:hypothetical protein